MDINIDKLNQINAPRVLGDLGFSIKDTTNILDGDFDAIINKTHTLPIIDLQLVQSNYLQMFNLEVLTWFFKKAKNNEQFTPEETERHQECYSAMFRACFVTAKAGGFTYSLEEIKEPNENLLIKVGDEVYNMMKAAEGDIIVYLETYDYFKTKLEGLSNRTQHSR